MIAADKYFTRGTYETGTSVVVMTLDFEIVFICYGGLL